MKKSIKVLIGILVLGIVIIIVNFLPTVELKTKGMRKFEGEWIDVYYEMEEAAAKDVFEYADSETEAIVEKLGFDEKQDVDVHIYDSQQTMQTKKYGYIAPLLGLDWYIGDNIETDVLLTSPANPGNYHDYDNIKYAVLHEIIHAYISQKNSNIHLWLTEGVALYLSNGEPFHKEYIEKVGIPTYKETCTRNPLTFSNSGGYTFAHTYIEYLDKTYGWDKVLQLIETEKYEDIYGKKQEEIYQEWVVYLNNYNQ